MKLAYLQLNEIEVGSTGDVNEIVQQFSAERGKKVIIICAT